MSKLSELIPAGGSAKELSAVASGTLASGQAVVLKANGQVEAIAPISQAVGSSTSFTSVYASSISSAYDSSSNKIIVTYNENTASPNGYAVVGTVSGMSISFGTPVVFNSGTTSQTATTYDSVNNKIVIAYRDNTNSNFGTAIVGTVSGTSISFGTPVVFESALTMYTQAVYDSSNNKVVLAFYGTSNQGRSVVGTVSGTSISFGATATFLSTAPTFLGSTFDSNLNKVVVVFSRGNSNAAAVVGTVSGTSISFGAAVTYRSGTVWSNSATFDSSSNKVVIAYTNNSSSYYGTAVIGTISGTSISFGTSVVFASVTSYNSEVGFDSSTNNATFAYAQVGATTGKAVVGTVSGTSISFGAAINTPSGGGTTINEVVIFDSGSNKMIVSFRDVASTYGKSFVFQNASTNILSFVGFASEAISSGATGVINPVGGVAASVSNVALSLTTGSKVVFDDAGPTTGIALAYDPDTAKVVNVFCSTIVQGIVGTVSGTSISYGSAASANGNSSSATQVAYDTVNNKIVAVYKEGFNDARVVIGTVSGTAISWGTPVVFASVNAATPDVAFDTNAGKVLIVYKDQANSNHGKAVVGTVSGTSISIGSPVTFLSANANKIQIAYDANAQKSVLVVEDYSNSIGVAYVATISGTSVSFGSQATFLSAAVLSNALAITYNSTDNKVVIGYGKASDNKGYLITGTVSGTSISFAGETVFSSTTTTNDISLAYKASGNVLGMVYNIGGSTTVKVNAAVISGTSFSFGTEQELTAGATDTTAIVVDLASGNFVVSYGDGSNNYDGTSNVVSVSTSLTIGTTYYVQADGTVSTVSTSPAVNAGKAISATSLLLKG